MSERPRFVEEANAAGRAAYAEARANRVTRQEANRAGARERCIAARVLMCLAGVDRTASKIVRDPDFDYEYLAQHFDV